MARRPGGGVGARVGAAAGRRARAVADRRQHPRPRRPCSARSAACSSASAARGASASSCPTSVAKVSLRAVRAGAAARRRISISWSAGRSGRRRRFRSRMRRSATCPGMRAEDGQEFVVSLARRDVVEEYENLCAEAGAHAGIVDLATFNVINAVLAGTGGADGRLAARERRQRLHVDRAPARAARDLLPQPRGRHRRHARRPRPPDGDVLRGSAEGRRPRAGAAVGRRRRRKRTRPARSIRSAAASRSACATPVDTVDPRAAATLTDRITAAPALLDALTPLVGLLLRDRAGVAA